MLTHRVIRVLVPYSRTLFFNDKGRERGITADNFREFERFLNQKYRKELRNIPFTLAFIPVPRNQLISDVVLGIGDIAAGNLTETDERSKQVDFAARKEERTVSEIVLTRKQDGPLTKVDQLSGRTIQVRQSSSYFESLQLLNKILIGHGKTPIIIDTVSENLEDEDLMEMLDAGIIETIVVDDWKAKMWAQILPNIEVNEHVSVRGEGYVGCAIRKNSPLLTAELNDFYYNHSKKLGITPYLFKKYHQQVKHLQDPINSRNARRYSEIIKLFEKYGQEYDFDPLMLAAMGFQESGLNQNVRSRVGAIGVMQLMPKIGASMKVGDIRITEPNIHAGTKYIYELMTKYFRDAHFDELNRSLFAFASYNAGPGRITILRKMAADRGLDPNIWPNNVEILASEKIGRETTTYVRNILKYYYSYKLMLELAEVNRRHRLMPASVKR
ncbi:MAG: lytic transglycosylase F [Bacteroidetes bacterium]|nr:MAG: lytic transglycosylase F [Bacteroidota bacterium]